MEQKEKKIFKSHEYLSYHIWILDSTDDWVHYYGEPLTENDRKLFSKEHTWPKLTSIENDYVTVYNSLTNSQLFLFETEVPESTLIRASIYSSRTLTELECDHFVLKIRYLLLQQSLERHWHEHETWLEGLHSLTSMLKLEELLHNIMNNTLIAIPAIDRGFLMLYDTNLQKLIPKASIGLSQSIYDFKTNVGEGIGGKVFQDGIGRIFSPEQGLEAISNIQPNNMKSLKDSMESEGETKITSMAVPVSMNNDKLGVMIVHQINKKRKLTKDDLRRLQGFADQAAIAITNARLFSELRESNEYLLKRNQIHEIFTKLLLKDSDLIMVAKTVEQMINLPVSLFDMTKNDWYPHYTPLSKMLKNTDLIKGGENHVNSWTATINEISVYFYPIVNDGVLIGYFVVELRGSLGPLDTVVLEQGSALVALKMVNKYSMTDLYYKQCYEFFNDLLQYKEIKLLDSKSRDFGLNPEKPIFVSIIKVNGNALSIKKRETYLRMLIAALHKEFETNECLMFGFQDKVTIIMNASNSSKQELLIKKLKNMIQLWTKQHSPNLSGGIGRLYQGLEHVAKSNEEAIKSLTYLSNRGTIGIISYESIGINRLFLNQQNEDIQQFIQDVFAPLQTPKSKASELELTLRTFIATNRSISDTAKRLHIHQNTLYYRIRKIEETLIVDLNDSNVWLKLLLACHLSETY
ncbi:GAF domain-containing protein [Arthrobacter citreus]|nr:GAF domain-containing protein [Arthrobacter citreus]